MTEQPIRRALLSVWDKTGLVAFARELVSLGAQLVSTESKARRIGRSAMLQLREGSPALVAAQPGGRKRAMRQDQSVRARRAT